MSKATTFITPNNGSLVFQLSQEVLESYCEAVGDRIVTKLIEQLNTSTSNNVRHYTRQECCSILRCSLPTFHSLVNKGLIPISKVGRKTLIPASEFDRIVASGELARYKHHPMKKEGGIAYGN